MTIWLTMLALLYLAILIAAMTTLNWIRKQKQLMAEEDVIYETARQRLRDMGYEEGAE